MEFVNKGERKIREDVGYIALYTYFIRVTP